MKKAAIIIIALLMLALIGSCSSESSTDSYSYNTNDKYYSANDYNNDGDLSDSEFRGAVDDYMDDYFAAHPESDPGYDY